MKMDSQKTAGAMFARAIGAVILAGWIGASFVGGMFLLINLLERAI